MTIFLWFFLNVWTQIFLSFQRPWWMNWRESIEELAAENFGLIFSFSHTCLHWLQFVTSFVKCTLFSIKIWSAFILKTNIKGITKKSRSKKTQIRKMHSGAVLPSNNGTFLFCWPEILSLALHWHYIKIIWGLLFIPFQQMAPYLSLSSS